MKSLLNILLISNVFLSGFASWITIFNVTFEFYLGYIFILISILYYFIRYQNLYVNRTFLTVIFILVFFSIINVLTDHNHITLLLKQIIGISITATSYYMLIKINNYNVCKLYSIYIKFAFVIALIGLIQQFFHLSGLNDLSRFYNMIPKWRLTTADSLVFVRINSILPEPSHFAAAIVPATCTSLIYILSGEKSFLNKSMALTFIFASVLSFSIIGYISILLGIISSLKFRTRFKYIPIIIILPILFSSIYFIPDFKNRIGNSIDYIGGKMRLEVVNYSTYAIVSNAYVSYEVFKSNPVYGHGLGSHPVTYDSIISSFTWRKNVDVNRLDAGSLFLRLISETGLIGLFVVLYFIGKFYLQGTNSTTLNKKIIIANNSIFCLFVLSLIRQGHYFYNGLFLFVWLYYFSYLLYSNNLKHCSGNAARIPRPMLLKRN